MKNKYSILLLVFILIVAGFFAINASGIKIPYFENYGTNFRRNVKAITEKFGWDLPEPVEEFLNKTPEPLTVEEKLEIIEKMEKEEAEANASPTPEIIIENEKIISVSSKITALKNAYAAAYASYNDGLLCAYDTLLVLYDNEGREKWKKDIHTSTPILKTAGKYILVAEKNGTNIYLFKNNKLLWERTNENAIVSADVSKNGDVVIISDELHYKGVVSVINKNGDVVYKWNSGKYEVIDADISPTARHLAVVMLNTDEGADTKISLFDLKESESYATQDIKDSIVYDAEFCGETLNAIADNKIIGINKRGNIIWTKDFADKTLHRCSVEDSGYKMCIFDNNNVSEITIVNNQGRDKSSFESQAFPDKVAISDGFLLYNDERTLIFSTLSGRREKKYNCTRDIYKLYILDSDSVAVIYNSSLEFIKF